MNQEENINTKTEQKEKQDHYQKYRGNSLLILETLEHSGGLTTRQISDAILGNARVIAVTIQRLVHRCVIEKVENWGWKINVNGLKILSIFNKKDITTNNKNINIIQTQTQHKVNMKKEDQPIKQTENIPSCFEKAYCHIRRFMKDPIFNSKTAMKCNECIHDNPNNYPKNSTSWQVVNISNGI
jgi:hypothetical protein